MFLFYVLQIINGELRLDFSMDGGNFMVIVRWRLIMTVCKMLYPAAFEDEGGVMIPHLPDKEEMERCAFASRAGVSCLRQKKETTEIVEKINCGNCFLHPFKYAFARRRSFVKSSIRTEKVTS